MSDTCLVTLAKHANNFYNKNTLVQFLESQYGVDQYQFKIPKCLTNYLTEKTPDYLKPTFKSYFKSRSKSDFESYSRVKKAKVHRQPSNCRRCKNYCIKKSIACMARKAKCQYKSQNEKICQSGEKKERKISQSQKKAISYQICGVLHWLIELRLKFFKQYYQIQQATILPIFILQFKLCFSNYQRS